MLEDPHQTDTELDSIMQEAAAASASYETDDDEAIPNEEI